jgi:prolyl oligopeptidase
MRYSSPKVLCFVFVLLRMSVFMNSQVPGIPVSPKIPVPISFCKDSVVTDNYRWLENMQDTAVKQWFKAQANAFDEFASRIPGRDSLEKEFLNWDRMKSETDSRISLKNNCYFFLKTLPEDNAGKLYMRMGKSGKDKLLFDPSVYKKGHHYNIRFFMASEDASRIAFGIEEGGAEISRILIMDVKTGTFFNETIYPCWYGVYSWSEDNSCFYYTGHQNSDPQSSDFSLDEKLMVHRAGTDPASDIELVSRKHNPELAIHPEDVVTSAFSTDRKYFRVDLWSVSRNYNSYYAPVSSLSEKTIPWKRLFSPEDEVQDLTFANDSIYMVTAKNAPNCKVTVVSAQKPDLEHARVFMPEGKESITSIMRSAGYLFIEKSDGIRSHTLKYNLKTRTIQEVVAPEKGNVTVLTFGMKSEACLVSVSSWIKPVRHFDMDAGTGICQKSVFDHSLNYTEADNLEVREVEVKSHDGVMVPLTIIYPRDLKFDGKTCCILEGYGAYGLSETPFFGLDRLMFAKHHIVYAFAHVRGGGEKGESWHLGGFKKTKPNTWKDFIACAEYLIRMKYTSGDKMTAYGGSAGGILIGRAITERPDLFAAAILFSGECNPFLGELSPNGPVNIPEFGSFKNPDECLALFEMDALYHVKDKVKYPAVLCLTGINDPRVSPWSPAKFVAALQNSSSSGKAVLLRVGYDTGHSSNDKRVFFRESADMYTFALWATGHPAFQKR